MTRPITRVKIEVEDRPKRFMLVFNRPTDCVALDHHDAFKLAGFISEVATAERNSFSELIVEAGKLEAEKGQVGIAYRKGVVILGFLRTDRLIYTSLDSVCWFANALVVASQDAKLRKGGVVVSRPKNRPLKIIPGW